MKMSYMGIKQHCLTLERDGYLDTWRRPQKMGRPEMVYRLTRRTHDLFPCDSNDFTLELLRAIKEVHGPNGPEKLLFSVFERKTVTQGLADKDYIRMATRDTHYLAEPGDILVADFGGNLEVSNMGGQSVAVAQSCGLVGAVVNGAVRDVASFRSRKFPAWSKGTTPITGKCRMQAVEINGPVTLHDVLVEPGDLIVADDSGVCAIPADKAEYVLEKCRSIIKEEEVMRELIDKDVPISDLKPLYRKRYS